MVTSEHELQNKIRLLLGRYPEVRMFRGNVGQGWTAKRVERRPDGDLLLHEPRPFSTGLPEGWPDLFGFRVVTIGPEYIGQQMPVFCALEVKSDHGRLREAQKNVLLGLQSCGCLCGVVRSLNDALDALMLQS